MDLTKFLKVGQLAAQEVGKKINQAKSGSGKKVPVKTGAAPTKENLLGLVKKNIPVANAAPKDDPIAEMDAFLATQGKQEDVISEMDKFVQENSAPTPRPAFEVMQEQYQPNILDWSEHFYYDETSPSCLRWIKCPSQNSSM